jgi:propanol-preferring alcohol dehydrogenase
MLAMVLEGAGRTLRARQIPVPIPSENEVLIQVSACGVCRTDLHIVDGELPLHKPNLVPGHEIVGRIAKLGAAVTAYAIGDRVGVPWLGGTCGHCAYCESLQENLCDAPTFTGYDRDGGYAEYVTADARFLVRIPEKYDDIHAAPLLCAGLIGYRAYAMTEDAQRLGLYGFGAAAHIIAQVARQQDKQVYAFTRPGDLRSQQFARSLGVTWTGSATLAPPVPLDAAIIFASAGDLVPQALAATRKGATVVCAGIHMSDIPGFPYSALWGERTLRSVANLTREDARRFFELAEQLDLKTMPVPFALEDANLALKMLKDGAFDGAAVIKM